MDNHDLSRASSRTGSNSLWRNNGSRVFSHSTQEEGEDDEEILQWAALEKLPTYDRVARGLLLGSRGASTEVDIRNLGFEERKALLERLLKVPDQDNEKFLLKLKGRVNRVGIQLPTVEVRFENLTISADVHIGSRAVPTFLNSILNAVEGFLSYLHIIPSKKKSVPILQDISGIIKPHRMTLLLGPPGSGKTTLLLALCGKQDPNLKFSGNVTYNGHAMNEFVPQKTATYVSQNDVHIGEMTVRETLEFSARCQGVGFRYDMLVELARREKEANIMPDPDIDIFMKAVSTEGQEASAMTDYVLKILGLEICADTMVGDELTRGISGGQRKRVTTGEMLVGPANALFMDEISTGLDSSTTFQIVKSLRHVVHILEGTALISLLQLAPETYELFDDIILLSDCKIVYQGPREHVLEFFESVGFKCPERKAEADFLQEVTSQKDQHQYWSRTDQPYRFVEASEFVEAFQSFHAGQALKEDLASPFDKSKSHPAALTTRKYDSRAVELLKACSSRELLLMKRNSFVYMFNIFGILQLGLIAMSVFFRTHMHRRNIEDGIIFVVAIFFIASMVMFIGLAQVSMTVYKLPVFYKQRDSLFFPPWAYALPLWIYKIPISIIESGVWVFVCYYVIGFDPNITRLFKQYLALVLLSQMAYSLFRLIAAVCRNIVIANTLGTCWLLLYFSFSGVVISRVKVKKWWLWGYWSSPLMYGQSALVVNELRGNSWDKEMKERGFEEDRLVLLHGVSGAFRPGVLTALMGVSGAGKTMLMDVLAGRKTGGYIQGNIVISGFPKNQETFNRIAGYCEQNDIHSPHVTVCESLIYSAWLRLPSEVDVETRKMFIEEVMELVELTPLRGAVVGFPGVSGLSTEQRKRLTIAVELVANPSIIFMDEPTSGLDARAAAIVMRTVRNTVDTGRTVVCTIHQPSIDIFEAFDELFLLKRGGEEIYVGPLGHNSDHLIKYFEAIPGVSKIKDGYNPATWMLEVSSPGQEMALGIDFVKVYKESDLYRYVLPTIMIYSTSFPQNTHINVVDQFTLTIS